MRHHALFCVAFTWAVAGGLPPLRGDPDRGADAGRVARLIRQLGHEAFTKRQAASKELEAIGEPALAALRKAATDGDPETRRRAEQVIEAIAGRVTRRELEKLQGTWFLVAYELDGKRTKGEDKSHVFTFQGQRWSIRVGGQVFQAGTVRRIEVRKNLNAIDLAITEGSNIGATAASIYAVEGDSLKYLNCGDPRATEFATKPGDGRHYLTFRRAKP
jgi:uncharacterized protein (TIGR03067 family)